jgi:hypothetical protein
MTNQTFEIKHFPEGIFPNILKDYEEHDKSCSSIPHMWLGHKGGVSDMWSQTDCDDCGVCFYIDALIWIEGSVTDEIDDQNLCDCCNRKRQK